MNQYKDALNHLPVMPEVAAQILTLAESDIRFNFQQLEDIVKLDPGLTSRVLKVANSAMYARSKEIVNLQSAIGLMGFKNLRSMVVLVTASSLYKQQGNHWLVKTLWKEAVESAFMCKTLAASTGNRDITEEAFLAGLLQDIGKLAFGLAEPEQYAVLLRGVQDQTSLPDEALATEETNLFGINHKELGSEVLEAWAFPDLYVDICRDHGHVHVPTRHKKLIIIATVGATLSKIGGQTPTRTVVGFDAQAEKFLLPFLPYLGFSVEDAKTFRSRNAERVLNDPLYRNCMSLIA